MATTVLAIVVTVLVLVTVLVTSGNGGSDDDDDVGVYVYEPTLWQQIGQDIDGEALGDNSGAFVSLSAEGTSIAIGAVQNDGTDRDAGHVRVYQLTRGNKNHNNWTQVGSDLDGEAVGDLFGRSVSLSANGTMVAIGGQRNDGNGNNVGHVRVFRLGEEEDEWIQAGSDIDGEAKGDASGWSISLSADGTIVVIGARDNDDNGSKAGHAHIYRLDGGGGKIKVGNDIDGEAAGDWSGSSVSLSATGSIVAIGAPKNDDGGASAGHARVYEFYGGNWTKIGRDLDGEAANDVSGRSVSLSADGSTVAVGAKYNDDNGSKAGQVRVYRWTGGDWKQIGSDLDGEAAGNEFGKAFSLSANGTTLAVGGDENDGNGDRSGHVRIFQLDGDDEWVQVRGDVDGEAAGDNFGYSVSLSADGTSVAIGAKANDGNGSNSGHVRVYHLLEE